MLGQLGDEILCDAAVAAGEQLTGLRVVSEALARIGKLAVLVGDEQDRRLSRRQRLRRLGGVAQAEVEAGDGAEIVDDTACGECDTGEDRSEIRDCPRGAVHHNAIFTLD